MKREGRKVEARSRKRWRVLLGAAGLCFCSAAAAAQSPQHPPGVQGPWPKLVIRVGALVADIGSDVRIDAPDGGGGTSIDLADDLGFQNQTTTVFADGIWRFSRRNRLQVGYEGIRRDVSRHVAPRTIAFRGETFTAGTETQAFFDTLFISGDYGFAFVAHPKVEVGATIGVTVMRIHTGLDVALQGTSDTTVSRELRDNTEYDVPVPLPGFFFNIRPHPRVTVLAFARVIKATFGDTTASLAEFKAGADYLIWHGVGVGGTYYFNRSIVERGGSSTNGRVEYRFNGPQVYVVFKY